MPFKDIKPNDFAWMKQTVQVAIPNQKEITLTQSQTISTSKNKSTALLMLHGFSSSPAVFRLIAPLLKNYDHIYIPTLDGHGRSIAKFAKSTAKAWLRDAENAFKTLKEQFEFVDVLGLSLGGLLACEMVHHYEIRNLFLLAPCLALTKNLTALKSIALILKELGFKNIANRGGRMDSPIMQELLYRQLPLTSIIELLNLIDSFHFKSWDTSTHLFLGQHDNVVNSKKVHTMLQVLPRLKVNYLANSNHVLSIDTDYEKIVEQINIYSSK